MERAWTVVLFVAGIGTLGVSAFGAVLPAAGEAGPHLVIAPPWGGGAEARILRAGGAVVGPISAPFAAVATETTPEALRLAGVWAVTGLPDPSIFCIEGTTE